MQDGVCNQYQAVIQRPSEYVPDFGCPICQNSEHRELLGNPPIRSCVHCGHAFRQHNHGKLIPDYSGKVKMPFRIEARYYARFHYDLIEQQVGFTNVKNLLEIGSGDGELLKLLYRKNPELGLFSIEASRDLCEGLRKIPNVHVINTYVEKVNLEQRFELVLLFSVLEHLPDPVKILRLIHDKFLEPGGHLVLKVPTREFELFSQAMARMAPAGHLHFFDGIGLGRLLASIGFDAETISGIKYRTIPAKYIAVMEELSRINERRMGGQAKRLYLKAVRRLSTYLKITALYAIKRTPPKIPFQEINHRFNNLVIVARKEKSA